jgi:hypothetical protein
MELSVPGHVLLAPLSVSTRPSSINHSLETLGEGGIPSHILSKARPVVLKPLGKKPALPEVKRVSTFHLSDMQEASPDSVPKQDDSSIAVSTV